MHGSARGEVDKGVNFTYKYLRVAMVALMIMFGAVPLTQLLADYCLLESISGYFYTPARTLFVGSLFGLGACLIAYQGHSDEEDVLLNFTGMMAFVVAIVPTEPEQVCTFVPENAVADSTGVVVNVITLSVIGVVAALVTWRIRRASEANPLSGLALFLSIASLIVLAVEAVLFLARNDWFVEHMHGIAANTMVVGVVGVIVANAVKGSTPEPSISSGPKSPTQRFVDNIKNRRSKRGVSYPTVYLVIALILIVALIVAAVTALTTRFTHFIMVCEWLIVVGFCVYWVVQTVELWPRSPSKRIPSRTNQSLLGASDESASTSSAMTEVRGDITGVSG